MAPIRFLQTAFESTDWVAVFLKTYRTGDTTQRIAAVSTVASARFQAWLRHRNADQWNVYVSVNAVVPGRSRTRAAIAAIRHVFVEEDHDGEGLLRRLAARSDLPPFSYVIHSSANRVHVFWRVHGFQPEDVELLQRQLSRELGTDTAATSCVQTTRLPGFVNHKPGRGNRVRVHYRNTEGSAGPSDFPTFTTEVASIGAPFSTVLASPRAHRGALDRARRYVSACEPAIEGRHGDATTFRICCRLVRGFALDDSEALLVLRQWNARCEPAWSERELLEKLRNARLYGREPVGGLIAQEC
jgi:hypothetical protein